MNQDIYASRKEVAEALARLAGKCPGSHSALPPMDIDIILSNYLDDAFFQRVDEEMSIEVSK